VVDTRHKGPAGRHSGRRLVAQGGQLNTAQGAHAHPGKSAPPGDSGGNLLRRARESVNRAPVTAVHSVPAVRFQVSGVTPKTQTQ